MAKIEQVTVISKEIVKPSSPTVNHQKPYYFPLFNQLTPSTYAPVIFFYPNAVEITTTDNIVKTLTHLKKSLSESLNLYYPFSGRIVDNFYIHSFDEGVPFLVTKVKGIRRLADFLKNPEIESLNLFLPYKPFTELDMSLPLTAYQVNVFPCGGIVIGMVGSHKLIDGPTSSAFINSWAALSRGNHSDIIKPELTQPSLFFPPKNPFPEEHLSLMESLWFTEANYITRRFVFDHEKISLLKSMAKRGEPQVKITRIEALSCFIWKCCMAASRAVSGSPRPSILVEAVNLRTRTNPPMSNASIGDLFWWANAVADPSDMNKELHELAKMVSDAIGAYDSDHMKNLQGTEGFETMSDYCDQLQGLFEMEKPDIFAFTSWCYFGFNKVDFGWGEPYWFGVLGKVGPAFRNLTVFVETRDGKGIEAWITLDDERMALLECDS
ncbi:hypothetical protein JCGZ_16164 [Jatropha curcas]|uniref:Uncharacterized protein n=2 Tax=Jatropha curcas TaxID=180498 RepID=A0A067KE00_JATCU|nr:hypothetical protein JCGZ_16164 [Jatropha curcas]